VEALDRSRQVYCVTRQRRFLRSPMRPERHIVQVFGRRPSVDDRRAFVDWLRERDFAPGDSERQRFDLAIMMSSVPGDGAHDDVVAGYGGIGYIEGLADPSSVTEPRRAATPELLVFGAFPRHAGSAQEVRDAVHEIVTTWLTRGGRIRFGGHPTFTPLVELASQMEVPGAERDRVTIVQSRHFLNVGGMQQASGLATVEVTDDMGDRASSLSVLRHQLVGGSTAVAAVAVGGRTEEGGTHQPGIEEEVELARAHGIPVFLLASPGGHTAVLAERAAAGDPAWSSLGNALSDGDNQWLATTDDYWRAAIRIWESATGEARGGRGGEEPGP
jgi:hypothetical protein